LSQYHLGRLFRALAVAGAIVTGLPGQALARESTVRLQAIELSNDERGALLTLSLSAPVTQHVFRLHSPERLVIDLPATQRRAKLPNLPATCPIISMRSGSPTPKALRLVVQITVGQPRVSRRAVPVRMPTATLATDAPIVASTIGTSTISASNNLAAATGISPPVAPMTLAPSMRHIRAAHAPSWERDIVIAVDAGHGGDDPGASGQNGTHEKDVTLAIARALAARIDRESGMRAVLIRDGDYFVALPNRIARARAAHADMFVSIHADAVRDREVSGASVYILSERGASSEAAKLLAEQQNAADLKGGISLAQQRPDVRSVLLDLSQSAAIGQSVEAADRVLGALDHVGAIRKHEVQQAAFVVLKSPDIPSMLVETAYISNPLEERRLRTPSEQDRLAQAIFSGVDSYFRKFPPEGSLYARMPVERTAASDGELARGF
jgi:N-acetylmuramoyl-L-alanine amidase